MAQDLTQIQNNPPAKPKPRYTGEILLRTRPKTYRKVVELLSRGESNLYIARECSVSPDTLRAIREREESTISERKNELTLLLSDVAHLASGRAADTVSKASFRDAIVGAGISVDKILALTGATPPTVGVVVMPSEVDRQERRAMDAKLDEIAQRLRPALPPPAQG